jgi:membrane-associated HD superfamily phosphohydrolase
MKWHLFALISMHTQLIVGLILYFTSERMKGFRAAGEVMKNSVSRFYVMEHLVGMVLAIVLVTIGYSKAKRQADDAKRNKTIFWFYLIALLIVIAMIPWPFREVGAGRSWF